MQGNAFLGAFFAVSSLLNEFGITPEQYREVVYKQYVKKFGKLGDAVVQSNMEVTAYDQYAIRAFEARAVEWPE